VNLSRYVADQVLFSVAARLDVKVSCIDQANKKGVLTPTERNL